MILLLSGQLAVTDRLRYNATARSRRDHCARSTRRAISHFGRPVCAVPIKEPAMQFTTPFGSPQEGARRDALVVYEAPGREALTPSRIAYALPRAAAHARRASCCAPASVETDGGAALRPHFKYIKCTQAWLAAGHALRAKRCRRSATYSRRRRAWLSRQSSARLAQSCAETRLRSAVRDQLPAQRAVRADVLRLARIGARASLTRPSQRRACAPGSHAWMRTCG